MKVDIARRKNLIALTLGLVVAACATQPGKEVPQRHGDLAKDSETTKVVAVHETHTLEEISAFDFDRRFFIYEITDEVANRLWKSPNNTVVKRKRLDVDGEIVMVELSDRDLDGKPDMFAYLPPGGGDTPAFGFMFDLNRDGRVDYLVYNGGSMVTREMEYYWMNYHLIDSNHDGRTDIFVNNAVTLDANKMPQKGLTAWVYDSDFDGYIDKAEYLGAGIEKPLPRKDGVLTVNWMLKDTVIGEKTWQAGRTFELVNAAMH